MTWTRDDGTTTPTYAGLCEFGGYRINDGTAKSSSLGMLVSSPPVRDSVSSLASDDGGLWGDPFLDLWTFDLEGWLWVPSGVADLWSAIDDLRSVFNLAGGMQQLTFKAAGWAESRFLTARVAGPVQITEPETAAKKVPRRDFLIPMVAADPRSFNADAAFSVNINRGSSGTVTNAGNYPSPLTAVFHGPLTNPQIDGPGSGGSNRIKLKNSDGTDFVISSGDSVTVTTNPSAAGGVTAIDNTGANVYSSVAAFTAESVAPGSESWALAGDAGSGHVTVSLRDAWV